MMPDRRGHFVRANEQARSPLDLSGRMPELHSGDANRILTDSFGRNFNVPPATVEHRESVQRICLNVLSVRQEQNRAGNGDTLQATGNYTASRSSDQSQQI